MEYYYWWKWFQFFLPDDNADTDALLFTFEGVITPTTGLRWLLPTIDWRSIIIVLYCEAFFVAIVEDGGRCNFSCSPPTFSVIDAIAVFCFNFLVGDYFDFDAIGVGGFKIYYYFIFAIYFPIIVSSSTFKIILLP